MGNQFLSTDSRVIWGDITVGRWWIELKERQYSPVGRFQELFMLSSLYHEQKMVLWLDWEEEDFKALLEIGSKYEGYMNQVATCMTDGKIERIFGWEEWNSGNYLGCTYCLKINRSASNRPKTVHIETLQVQLGSKDGDLFVYAIRSGRQIQPQIPKHSVGWMENVRWFGSFPFRNLSMANATCANRKRKWIRSGYIILQCPSMHVVGGEDMRSGLAKN